MPQHPFLPSLLALLVLLSNLLPLRAQQLFEEQPEFAPAELDKIYVRGLQFLARGQSTEGAWPDAPYGAEPAVVGLAVVSMLAHGDDANLGPYGDTIRHGLDYILKQMDEKTGYIGRSMYNHGFATLALAESYGMVDDARIGPALQKAVKLILSVQAKNPLGGWRYTPESTDADTTVSGAQMVALFAARNAGMAVPDSAIEKGLKFFLNCQTTEGGFGYTSAVGPNAARTAIGCLMLELAKQKESKNFKAAFAFLQKAPDEPAFQQYFLYYASQAYFHGSPDLWRQWNAKNIKMLQATQNPDGSWSGQFGTTFGTAASLLSVALNYRYLPIYER